MADRPLMATMADMWERNFRLFPDQIAVVCDGRGWTYRELIARSRQLGEALYRCGVGKGDRVAMLARNCPEWFDFYACCELHGFHATTVNFRLAPPEIAFILADAAPRVVFFEAEYAATLNEIRQGLESVERFVCIGGEIPEWAEGFEAVITTGSAEGPPFRPEPEDPVHLIYTSGTTGKPKGVVRTQRAALALAESCAVSLGMRANGRGLVVMPLFHVGAQSIASGQHWLGGAVTVIRNFEPVAVAEALSRQEIQMTHLAPSMIQQLIDAVDLATYDFSALETLCYASAPMPVPLLRQCLQVFGPVLYDCYGSTETGNVAVLQRHHHAIEGSAAEVARLASVGQEHHGSRLRVCDDAGRDCEPGTPGELCIRSDAMMSGYWNNSTATAQSLADGWFRSGDIARMDAQGFVYLVDRKKDMIISGGENIYCREVEEALATHPAVAEVAVIGVPDRRWGEAVKAIVTTRQGCPAMSAVDLIEHGRSRIAGYKLPKTVEFVDQLPRTSTGKINKVALRDRYSQPVTS